MFKYSSTPVAFAAALSLLAPAQSQDSIDTAVTTPSASPALQAHTTLEAQKALPGLRAGTESWIVHFAERPFDLSAFRAEMHGAKDPERVAAIVANLESKMKAHQKSFCDEVRSFGGRVTHQWWLINGLAIEIAPRHLAALRKLPNVAWLEPDVECRPTIKTATNANNHNSDALNARGMTGKGVACAIIDTGQDENMNGSGNPHITYSRRGTSTTRLVANFKIGTMSADDVHGHGTGVASIAAGWKWRTTQADHGHAYDANIVGYAIANNSGGGASSTNQTTSYQRIATDAARYRIVASNLSYTGSSNPASAVSLASDSAALNADVLNATAAGNSGTNVGASLCNINGISVGAVRENTHTLASFSSRGVQGGRLFPNMCANGVSTDMARRNNETSNYVGSGTSMASPQVCGAATLLRGAHRSLKSDETRAILLASTEQNPGSGAQMNSTGTGCGYLSDTRAHSIASDSALHGRASVDARSRTWRRSFRVTNGVKAQFAIAWHRLRLSSGSNTWSNLDLRVLRGATVVASSSTSLNTEEFVRFTPTANEVLTVEVRLSGSVIGATTQPFGWAAYGMRDNRTPGTYRLYGSGCRGTGSGLSRVVVLPRGYSSRWGESNNVFPWGTTNMRYMQAHSAGDIGTRSTLSITSLAFRTERNRALSARRIRCTVNMGHTRRAPRSLSTTFSSNWASRPVNVFNGTLNVPSAATNTSLSRFDTRVPFRSPFVYDSRVGNMLFEVVNRETTRPVTNVYDFVNSATAQVGRVYGSASATTGRLGAGQGLVTRLTTSSGGAIVRMTNTGVPTIASTFRLNLSFARASSVGVLFLGASQRNISLGTLAPGCSIYTSSDAVLGTVPTGSGFAFLTIPVPNNNALIGVQFYNQYMVLDAPANTLGLVFTNGGRGQIGN